MSLLVTSCTMGKQPDRLLNKGPDYLRTRTNHGIFSSENRKSAVELLAASKAQFYTIKDRTILDRGQDLAVTGGQHDRYSSKQKHRHSKSTPLTSRSKSEHNLSQLQLKGQEEDNDPQDDSANDLNNNSYSDVYDSEGDEVDSSATTAAVVEGTRRLCLESSTLCCKVRRSSSSGTGANCERKSSSCSIEENHASNRKVDKTVSLSAVDALNEKNTKIKPSPCPRKSKEKPIPPPRRKSPKVPLNRSKEQSPLNSNCKSNTATFTQTSHIRPVNSTHSGASECTSSLAPSTVPENQSHSSSHPTPVFRSTASLNLSSSVITPTVSKPNIPPRPRKLDSTPDKPNARTQETTTAEGRDNTAGDTTVEGRKPSLVESLTKRFTSLSASKPSPNINCEENSQASRSDKQALFKATPVFIGKPESLHSASILNTGHPPEPSLAIDLPAELKEINRGTYSLGASNVSRAGRKRCPDIEHSNDSHSKREKRSTSSSKAQKSKFPPALNRSEGFTAKDKSVANVFLSHSESKSEMSIESAEQAVSESEINAIPLATMESDNALCCGGDEAVEGQEITRRNSSRSGRLDPGDASQSSGGSGQRHSSGGYSSSVPRSHSDISFRLGSTGGIGGPAGEGQAGQHSRDSSIVSSHSRLSRASVGADLENFFNQMGLEMGVLEPMARLRELQTSGSTGGDRALGGDASTFGSMSSLDSQDAASICSTYSRSEHDCVGTGGQSLGASGGADGPPLAAGHHQQQTSIVERNARIIKWLCNVRKAIKGGQSKADGAGSSSNATTGKA